MSETNQFSFCFLFLIFFKKCFDNDRFFPAYLDQFAAGENVQVAGDIAGRRRYRRPPALIDNPGSANL